VEVLLLRNVVFGTLRIRYVQYNYFTLPICSPFPASISHSIASHQ